MSKFRMKFLSSASVAIIILSVSACSYKSDHPQNRQSFGERRDPKENTIAASGMLGSKKSHKVPVDYSNSATPVQPSDGKGTGGGSFFERLMNIGSDKSEKQSAADHISYAYNDSEFSREPQENDFEMARFNNGALFAQGSTDANYFEIAESIIPVPVHEVKESKLSTLTRASSLINEANAADEPAKLPALPQPMMSNDNKSLPGLPALDLPNTDVKSASKDVPAMPNPPAVSNTRAHGAPPMPPVPSVPQSLDMDNKVFPTQSLSPTPTMVKVPELPSNEQMRQEVRNQSEPQLNTVPAAPIVPQMPTVAPQQVPAHIVQPPVGHPTVPAVPMQEPKTPEVVTQTQGNNSSVIETKSANAKPVKPKRAKKVVRKVMPVQAEPDPVDFSSVQTMDNSVIVNENGRYVARKFLGAITE